tara:strand:+ start:14 stop:493 length:480 start_codon:yes stop_codon:yes gene_type:complete
MGSKLSTKSQSLISQDWHLTQNNSNSITLNNDVYYFEMTEPSVVLCTKDNLNMICCLGYNKIVHDSLSSLSFFKFINDIINCDHQKLSGLISIERCKDNQNYQYNVPKENIMLVLRSSSESYPIEFYLKYIFENTNSYEVFAHKDYQIRVENFIQSYFK